MTDVQQVILRIHHLAENKGISINQLLRESNLSKSVLDNMKRGSMPSADKLATIADYFNCSVDYILGRVDTPRWNQNSSTLISESSQNATDRLTPDEILQIRKLLHKTV